MACGRADGLNCTGHCHQQCAGLPRWSMARKRSARRTPLYLQRSMLSHDLMGLRVCANRTGPVLCSRLVDSNIESDSGASSKGPLSSFARGRVHRLRNHKVNRWNMGTLADRSSAGSSSTPRKTGYGHVRGRSLRSSLSTGKPCTWRRQAGNRRGLR